MLRAGRAGQGAPASTSATRSRSSHYENPRVEKEEHYYNAVHTKLLDLGLEPTLLGEELVESMIHAIERHKGRVIEGSIDPAHPLEPGQIPRGAGVAQALRAACRRRPRW